MKKIFLALIFILICTRSFAQFPILSNIYDDYEFSVTPAYQTNGQNIFYNNGTDIEVEIRERIKIKFPNNSGCNFCYGPNVTFPIFFEDMNGNRHLVGEFLHNYFANYAIEAGKIYSQYYLSKIKFKPEIMALGKGKIYFGVYEKDDPIYKTAATAYILKTKVDIDFIQVPKFIGPDAICNEATYTIERPGTISLENATGIATLTSLGNNQWKVTRTGTGSGIVKLRSTSNGKIYDKDIDIGTIAKGSISGNAVLQLGESQTYTLALNGNTDYNWSVTYNPNVTLTKLSATSIKLSTTGSVPMGWSENITISAQAVGSCGTSSNYISKTIKFVNERDPRLD